MSNFNEQSIIKNLRNHSGIGMFAGLSISLLICLIVDMFHFYEIFKVATGKVGVFLAIAGAIFFQGMRLISAIAGINEFSNGKKYAGFFGLVISFILTVICSLMYFELSGEWFKNNDSNFLLSTYLLQTIVWCGLILEIRIILNVEGKS